MSFRRLPIITIVILGAFLSITCQKKIPEPVRTDDSNTATSDKPLPVEKAGFQVPLVKLNSDNFEDFDLSVQPFYTDAHKSYLSDPMKFVPLPDQNIHEGATAVVGSRVCVLYTGIRIESSADLAKLTNGTPVPFGTILPIVNDKIGDPDNKDRYGMFQFQDNWNWFYRTRYKGQDGIVFGADLYGLNDTNVANRISARLYQTKGKYDAFHPVVGYHTLPARIVDRLEKDRLAIQSVAPDEYDLSGYRTDLMPDDMIALYAGHSPRYEYNPQDWRRKTPIFVTTDLASHTQHLMFDRTLQYIEESFFLPRLKTLVGDFLTELGAREPHADAYRESMDKAVLYFQVANALLELAPDRVHNPDDKYGADRFVYKERNMDEVLAIYPEAVREEIAKIYKAQDFFESSVFSFKNGTQAREDYSQYKPRGHYTKNGALAAYFRAMMWFGRIHFLIAVSGPATLPDKEGQSSDAKTNRACSHAMAPQY